jgi:TIR domain
MKFFRWVFGKGRGRPTEGLRGSETGPIVGPSTFPVPADVVVSYARRDSAMAEPLIMHLRAQGINVWWDRELYSGEDLHDAIVAALDAAKAVIVIWSETAAASMWVRDEARRAARKSKLITAHVPGFDLEKIPLGFGERRCDNIEDRTQLIRALGRFGIQPQDGGADLAQATAPPDGHALPLPHP